MILLGISSWWQGLEVFEKALWGITIISSALFVVQLLISVTGGDGDDGSAIGSSDDLIGDDSGIGHQVFTVKNLIAFFTMFGWVGIASYNGGMSKGITIVIAVLAGLAMVMIMVFLLRNVNKLKHSGTMQIKNALNQVCETYLFIPAKRNGLGKVHIRIQGSLHELDAMTDDETQIPTGKIVKVTGIINDQILLVSATV
jgi:predicted HicB family RNase H-like nuclease